MMLQVTAPEQRTPAPMALKLRTTAPEQRTIALTALKLCTTAPVQRTKALTAAPEQRTTAHYIQETLGGDVNAAAGE